MVDGSIRALFSFGGMFSLSYVNVSVGMYTITYISRKRIMYGVKFWYQLLLGIVIVMICGSFFAISLTQCMASYASFLIYGWAYPTPFHLCKMHLQWIQKLCL